MINSYCKMINGDATQLIEHINVNVQTWIIDPPYNIGFKYDTHNDSMHQDDYNYFNHKIAKEMYNKTQDSGSMFYINYPEICAVQLKEIQNAGWVLNQWLSWVYPCNFGFSNKRFTRASRAVLWFVKSENYYFNHTVKGEYKDPNDSRVKKYIKEGKKPRLFDWFEINLCKNTSKEYRGYKNQIPQKLLEILILNTSKPGDLIGDPCSGSGSTLITAKKHNRNSIGFELDSKAVDNFNQYLSENKTLFEVLV